MSEVKVKISDKVQGVIESEADNRILGRKELQVTLFHIGAPTPSRKELLDGMAKVLQAKKEQLVLRKINTSYGAGVSKIQLNLYDNTEGLKRYESRHILDRDSGTKQKKGGKNA